MSGKLEYPLASSSWDEAELQAIQAIVDGGMFTMGAKVREFEQKFADYVGSKHAVMVNSGSSANLLGIQAMIYAQGANQLRPGDAVIVPAIGWSTTYFPLHQSGLKLIFVDVDPTTFNLDIDQVREAASMSGAKAVFAVNLLGRACPFDELRSICDEFGLLLMEDNCEAFGARYKGKMTGAFGAFGSFSFFFSHHLVTMEGGMIVTDDPELYSNLLCMRAHGWTRELPEESHLHIEAPAFTKKFRFALPGFNLRPVEMSGAIGLAQLKKADEILANRRLNARLFYEVFEDCKFVQLPEFDEGSSWFGYGLVVRGLTETQRDELAGALSDENIESRPILTGNFLNNPAIEYLDYRVVSEMRTANAIDTSGLFFGAHNYPLEAQFRAVRDVIERYCDDI